MSAAKVRRTQKVFILATMDTKGLEAKFIADAVRAAGVEAALVDIGLVPEQERKVAPDYGAKEIFGDKYDHCIALPKGERIAAMSSALEAFVKARFEAGEMAGVLGMGGSGGTSMITPSMRNSLPIGFPKLMVSTVASGETRQYVGSTDICMMYSVVDECGINRVSQQVFTNAAWAMAGMAKAPQLPPPAKPKGSLALTMFGVTTACVSTIETKMNGEYDCLVFHCTGAGGMGMEKMIADGKVAAVMDITTTELCDLIAGNLHGPSCIGVMSAGPTRLQACAEAGIPAVVSVGALDMVNFNGINTVPAKFAAGSDRVLFVHNAGVTLMRTTVEENVAMGEHMVAMLSKAKSPLALLWPEGGVSVLDQELGVGLYGATFDNWKKITALDAELAAGSLTQEAREAKVAELKTPWEDKAADAALLSTLEKVLAGHEFVKIIKVPHNINTPEFAEAALAEFAKL